MRTFSRGKIAVLLGLLVASAGCVGLLTGDEPMTFSADPISVSGDAVQEAGYQLDKEEPVVVERSVSFQGQERQIEITNHVAVYRKSVLGMDAGFFVAFSTPRAEVVGQALNPLGRLPKDELLEQVASQGSDVDDVSRTGSFDQDILGETRTVDSYTATTTADGQQVELTLHVVRFTHEGDIVIGVGAYPREYSGEDEIRTMFEGIEHPA